MKKKSLKYVLSVALILLLALPIVGCGNGGAEAPAGDTPGTEAPAEGEVVRIGWIGALTGDMAVWGISESSSIQMFIDELNEAGGLLGRQVELVAYDTRGDSAEAVNAVRRLVSQDGVIGVVGPNTSGQAIPIASVLEEFSVPGIATVATNPRVTVAEDGTLREFSFRVCFVDAYQGAVAAGYSFNVLGARTAAVLYDVGSDYSLGITEVFEESFTALGGEIVALEAFNPGDVDFRPQLTSIGNLNPDIIFMPYTFREVALSAQQARELGITSTFIGTDTWPSMQLLEMAAEFVEGSYFINHLDLNDPRVAGLRNKYIERHGGREPEINAFLGWDAMQMLVEAIERAGSFDTVAIRDELRNTDFEGYTGHIVISSEDHNPVGKQAAIIRITNGEFIFQQTYSPYD